MSWIKPSFADTMRRDPSYPEITSCEQNRISAETFMGRLEFAVACLVAKLDDPIDRSESIAEWVRRLR